MSTKEHEVKTSAEWLEFVQKETGDDIIISDPDGWDRRNFDASFNKEKITRAEFDFRLSGSTVMYRAARPVELPKAS